MADYDAMTVNERLFGAGLLSDYDAAVASSDLDAINLVLEKVGLRQDESGMNWSLSKGAASDRKTLQLRAPTETAEAPALEKKGRGWKISDKRLDALHDRAREMRRHSSEAHKALAERFAKADLGRYSFKRQAVVGSAILDFNCHNLGMAVAIDEPDQDDALARRRDKSLESVGIKVMRIAAADILENMDDVLARITAGMRLRIADKGVARRQHFSKQGPSRPSHGAPRPQGGPRPNRTGNAKDR